MKQKIHFVKMHGVGNDYIFVDTSQYPIEDPQALAILWSRYHFGIGSDGLVLIGRSTVPEADFTMRIFNADGSEGLMCGNASRCIGKYVYERGMTDKRCIRLMTASGIKILNLDVDDDDRVSAVTVDMLVPALADARLFLPDGDPLPDGTFVSMGNPHYVIFVDDIDDVDRSGVPRRHRHACVGAGQWHHHGLWHWSLRYGCCGRGHGACASPFEGDHGWWHP